jgi:hypothetical protein
VPWLFAAAAVGGRYMADFATFCHTASGWSVDRFPALDSPRTLIVAFGAADIAVSGPPLAELRAAYPQARLIGCSSAGEIHGPRLLDGSLVVGVARFDRSQVDLAQAGVERPEDSFEAGASLAHRLLAPDLRAIFVLSDGLRVNGSELVRGLASGLPADVVVTGGLAADGPRFERTWVSGGGEPTEGLVVAAGLRGDVHVAHGSRGGWDIFGPERLVTRARGNVLYELDGRPALELYKTYLGDRAAGLPATGLLFPLSVRADHADQQRLVRTILAVDEAAQSLTFAGDVPEGHLAQLMRANFDRLIAGAADSALMCNASPDRAALTVAISCVGRRLVLGERVEEELEATAELLPRQIGYYSYGEISPYASGACELHNQTMTLSVLAEL